MRVPVEGPMPQSERKKPSDTERLTWLLNSLRRDLAELPDELLPPGLDWKPVVNRRQIDKAMRAERGNR